MSAMSSIHADLRFVDDETQGLILGHLYCALCWAWNGGPPAHACQLPGWCDCTGHP